MSLPGGQAPDALAAFVEHGERLSAGERQEARLLLWKATRDRAHLDEAKRLLEEALVNVPEEYREEMRASRRVHREILAAWQGESAAGSSGGEPHGTESITRAGPS